MKKEKRPTAREGSKKAEVLALLRRDNGATLHDLMSATGWQAQRPGLSLWGARQKDGPHGGIGQTRGWDASLLDRWLA